MQIHHQDHQLPGDGEPMLMGGRDYQGAPGIFCGWQIAYYLDYGHGFMNAHIRQVLSYCINMWSLLHINCTPRKAVENAVGPSPIKGHQPLSPAVIPRPGTLSPGPFLYQHRPGPKKLLKSYHFIDESPTETSHYEATLHSVMTCD